MIKIRDRKGAKERELKWEQKNNQVDKNLLR